MRVCNMRASKGEMPTDASHKRSIFSSIDASSLDVEAMTVTSVPCQVVRSTTQVYFNIRVDQKRRRAIHFCEQCRYYGRYCDAIHKGRNTNSSPDIWRCSFDYLSLVECQMIERRLYIYTHAFLPAYRLLSTCFDAVGTYIDLTENSQVAYQFCFRKTLPSRTNTATYSRTNPTEVHQSRGDMAVEAASDCRNTCHSRSATSIGFLHSGGSCTSQPTGPACELSTDI
jgi:hypothetical protein